MMMVSPTMYVLLCLPMSLYTRGQCMTDIVEVRLCGEAFGLYASPITIVICSEVIATSYCI